MTARGIPSGGSRTSDPGAMAKRLRQAQRRLRDLERRHETVMGAIGESVYDWDIARDRIDIFPGIERAIGLSPDAVKSPRDWWDRIHPEDQPRYRLALVAHFKDGASRFECDYRYRARDDSWRWARQRGLAMRNRKGLAVRMIGATGDITELKERERQLAEKSATLETTLEYMVQGITLIDGDLRTIAFNRRLLDILDFPPERFAQGFTLEQAFRFNAERGEYGPGDVDQQVNARLELARRFEPHDFERTRPDGRVIAISGRQLPDRRGFVTTYTDVTEQRRSEASLKRSEERYALATSAAVEGIYEWDVAAGTLFLTERAKEFFAVGGDTMTPAAWNVRVHPDDLPGYQAAVVEHFKGRTPVLEHEYRIAAAGGAYRWVVDRGIGVRSADGRVTRVVGALSDVTQRKQAEIEVRRARDQAEQALERQVATSDILRVISQSPTEVQPAFEAIAAAALKLCNASSANVLTLDGGLLRVGALANATTEGADAILGTYPRPPDRGNASGRAVLSRALIAIPDVLDDPEYATREAALAGGLRSALALPLLRDGSPVGAIVVGRPDPGPFADGQVALLQTFADQALIAIENVRLFRELEARTAELTRSLGELRALAEVGRAISSTLDLETVLSTIVSRATGLAGMDGGAVFEYDELREEFWLHATDGLPDELVEALGAAPVRKGEGAIGRLAVTAEPVQIEDIVDGRSYRSQVRDILLRSGCRSLLAVPLLCDDRLLGGLIVTRNRPGGFATGGIDLPKAFATQSALAIQNARLFRQIEQKSRELEAASRHKSEFLANMSHELRTPLNAIIGFSEVLAEGMFGAINDKQAEYLRDILESGRHLLALINDILDLSKIEAGRVELDPSELDLPAAIENALILVRERASRNGIALGREVDPHLGAIRADERKVKQVLLNLLSNAIKFTPDGGRIDVRARLHDGAAEISVTDTGVGIAPQDQAAVFEEFRQVGAASKKVEGTGLGLAISRRFVELHGGRIWVRSEPGAGATFAFTLPLTLATDALTR